MFFILKIVFWKPVMDMDMDSVVHWTTLAVRRTDEPAIQGVPLRPGEGSHIRLVTRGGPACHHCRSTSATRASFALSSSLLSLHLLIPIHPYLRFSAFSFLHVSFPFSSISHISLPSSWKWPLSPFHSSSPFVSLLEFKFP
jgi:hypothetical protein